MNKRRKEFVFVCFIGCVVDITDTTYDVSEQSEHSRNKCAYCNNILNSFGNWKVLL